MDPKTILFIAITQPAAESVDGETPGEIIVTQEHNGAAIWRSNSVDGITLVDFDQTATAPDFSMNPWLPLKRRTALLERAAGLAAADRRMYARMQRRRLQAEEAAK